MNARPILATLLLWLAAGAASAGTPALPEPGILELLAISAVAGIAIALRNRRK